jgi:hypothetical protein
MRCIASTFCKHMATAASSAGSKIKTMHDGVLVVALMAN